MNADAAVQGIKMPSELYSPFNPAEAVAAFGDPQTAQWFCDGQPVVLPKSVLCFATVGNPDSQPFLGTPASFVWKPGRLNYDSNDKVPWFPTAVREVWGSNRETLKEHHVFLRPQGDEKFIYVGNAHLGSWGGRPGEVGEMSAGFSLNSKLPRDLWTRLGGYPGWEVEVNHQVRRMDIGDLSSFRSLLDELSSQKFGHLQITRYEEDSLTIHTNSRRGWLMYLRFPADSGLYTHDEQYAGDSEAEEFFLCACGIDLEFLASRTLPKPAALRLVEEFFVSGELPRSVPWTASY